MLLFGIKYVPNKNILPDMLEPAMIPVQPLNMTANTVAKLMTAPVV